VTITETRPVSAPRNGENSPTTTTVDLSEAVTSDHSSSDCRMASAQASHTEPSETGISGEEGAGACEAIKASPSHGQRGCRMAALPGVGGRTTTRNTTTTTTGATPEDTHR
jgi:hypothetical protein